MAGRKKTSIVNTYLTMGTHCYLWDNSSVARGCYVVRLKIGADVYIKLIQVLDD
jgi:hypothetical protein